VFTPFTERIKQLQIKLPQVVAQLDTLFDKPTNIYIDFANAIHWQERLGWKISLKRMKQFFDSFPNIREVKFYNGEMPGSLESLELINDAKRKNYVVRSKLVKRINLSINVSSIPLDSTIIIGQFMREALLKKLTIENIEYLNNALKELNKKGTLSLQDFKCNFDVEIGVDMLLDCREGKAEIFVLMSGDSDFHDPVHQLLIDYKKKVVLFSTAREISRELNDLRAKGLIIFEINRIREFLCFTKEMKYKV
jgi:uncharacterized LabA/DUF88 family protein